MGGFVLALCVDWLLMTGGLFAVYLGTRLGIERSSSGAISEWSKHLNLLRCEISAERVCRKTTADNIGLSAILSTSEQTRLQSFLDHHYRHGSASKRISLLKSWPRFLAGAVIIGLLISSSTNYSLLYGHESIKTVVPNIEKLLFLMVSLAFSLLFLLPHFNGFNDLKDAASTSKPNAAL